jgi:hypothetical protein
MTRRSPGWLRGCALLLLIVSGYAAAQKLPLDKIKLPPGFEISVFADNVPNAHQLPGAALSTVQTVRCVRSRLRRVSQIF